MGEVRSRPREEVLNHLIAEPGGTVGVGGITARGGCSRVRRGGGGVEGGPRERVEVAVSGCGGGSRSGGGGPLERVEVAVGGCERRRRRRRRGGHVCCNGV